MKRGALAALMILATVGSASAERKLVVAADEPVRAWLRAGLGGAGFTLVDSPQNVDGDAKAGEVATASGALATVWLACGSPKPSKIRGTNLAGATVQCRVVATSAQAARLGEVAHTTGGSGADAASAAAQAIATAAERGGRKLAVTLEQKYPAPSAAEAGGVTVVVSGALDWPSLSALMNALSSASGDKGKKSPAELRRVAATEVRFRARTSKSPAALATAVTKVPQDTVTIRAAAAGDELRIVLEGEAPAP